MDYHFPQKLFPTFYNCGPPDVTRKHCAGNWGSYDHVKLQGGAGPPDNWTFTSSHQIRGEIWRHKEPAPIPFFKPSHPFIWSSAPPDPLHFTAHMQNFYWDHCQDAFGCITEVLGNYFRFKCGLKKHQHRDAVHTWKITRVLDKLSLPICHECPRTLQRYSALLSDAVQSVPPELLGSLLHEELTEQRDRQRFSEGATGGALNFIPFSQSGDSQHGCLLYPGNQGMDRLNFHRVELDHHRDKCFSMNSSESKPFSFQLKGPIRQISAASLFNICCVSVRSDHLCGVWRFSEREEPRLLQVVDTKEVFTCASVSPHILGEVLVASESGTTNLWTVGKGIQKVWEDTTNLYFNAKSSWRWCEFSAHPRVMLYADRTGADLCDIRASPRSNQTLFRISSSAQCQSGERLILCKYLADAHPFHHLVTTQYSAYIMDERFPCLPMLKMDHMMQSPPMFCHILPGVSSSCCGTGATKVLLGSQSSQEITQLQYSGGRAEVCVSLGPPQALLRPCDSLKHLPVQIPHRMDTATNRLSSASAGLTCIQRSAREGSHSCIYVLQLTEAGDIFYQTLVHEPLEDEASPGKTSKKQPHPTLENAPEMGSKYDKSSRPYIPRGDSQSMVPDTSSDEDVLGPTQGVAPHKCVPETPEKKVQVDDVYSDTGSQDSETRGKGQNLKRLHLRVLVNDDTTQEHVDMTADGEDENATNDPASELEQPSRGQETPADMTRQNRPIRPTPVKLSEDALTTWKRWLQKLMRKSHQKKLRPRVPNQFTVKTRGHLRLSSDKMRELSEDGHVASMRRQLSACMSERSLLLRSDVSSEPLDVIPFPDQVDTGAWRDDLSQRLSLSWDGEEKWQGWWEDRLGLNREQKIDALKRKRKRYKRAKSQSRAQQFELSESFSSSVTCPLDTDDFSNLSGWSSSASQGALSDKGEEMLSPAEGTKASRAPRAASPTNELNVGVRPTPVILSQSETIQLDSTPSSQKRSKRPGKDYLDALFGSQEDPSQHNDFDAEQQSLGPVAHSSRSLPLSQSSLGRPRSQVSQPKKKKARMGF
ncbi:TATA box-binding protein-associated factor RNA polymerase I subunit C isoform X2 [Phyllopteryx taeniolatus]|uniref:TATA box-binding protein-associated factor RNA polymerase I subunit C isoform X2 n=1 Tax=Phyllopteryx taeniolatus TaxID=161469 RepID=UPI002AD4B8F2|nr:TATA box-binding protein-associated factor RNA polymerase I subunit C isoform X2 [Phyllopteryx taeniolatus]